MGSAVSFSKPATTRRQEQRARRTALEARDELGNIQVKARSMGWCELHPWTHCGHRLAHIHHMLGGVGRRGVGDSALPQNKIAVCALCHHSIHSGDIVLQYHDETNRFRTLHVEVKDVPPTDGDLAV